MEIRILMDTHGLFVVHIFTRLPIIAIIKIHNFRSDNLYKTPIYLTTADTWSYRTHPKFIRSRSNFHCIGDGSDQGSFFFYDGSRYRRINALRVALVHRPRLAGLVGLFRLFRRTRFPPLPLLIFLSRWFRRKVG